MEHKIGNCDCGNWHTSDDVPVNVVVTPEPSISSYEQRISALERTNYLIKTKLLELIETLKKMNNNSVSRQNLEEWLVNNNIRRF